MQILRYEGDLHKLRTWAVNRDDNPPEPFNSWFLALLPEDCRGNVGHYIGVITPDSPLDGDWVRGYPHCHVKSVNWHPKTVTVVTYLAAPEVGGEFGLGGLSPNDPYEFIKVESGMAVMMDGATWHGARPVLAGTRIALISSGTPEVN